MIRRNFIKFMVAAAAFIFAPGDYYTYARPIYGGIATGGSSGTLSAVLIIPSGPGAGTYTYTQAGGTNKGNYYGPGFTETCIEAIPPTGAPAGLSVRFHQDISPGTHWDVRFRMGACQPATDPSGTVTTALAASQILPANATIQIFNNGIAQSGYFGPNAVSSAPFYTGVVTAITMTSPGTGYFHKPTFVISSSVGSGAVCHANDPLTGGGVAAPGMDNIGANYGGTPVTVTVVPDPADTTAAGAVAVATVLGPCWYQRFRFQNAPRPVLYSSATLIAAKLIPPMGASDVPNSSTIDTPTVAPTVFSGPLSQAGLILYEDATGEAYERGVLTEWAAYYIIKESSDPDAIKMMLNTAEASGSIPWAIVDAATGAPISLATYPNAQMSNHNTPVLPNYYSSTQVTGWDISDSHYPSLSPVAFMYTRDSYFLENAQFEGNYAIVNYAAAYISSVAGFPIVDTDQDRSIAWGMRSLLYGALCTQQAEGAGSLPGWLTASSSWTGLLPAIMGFFNSFVSQVSAFGTHYYMGPHMGYVPPWEVSYLTCTMSFLYWAGFTTLGSYANYKVGWHVGFGGGVDGWPAAQSIYYASFCAASSVPTLGTDSHVPDDPALLPAYANWGTVWNAYETDGNISLTDYNAVNLAPNTPATTNIASNGGYIAENRAALAWSVIIGNTSTYFTKTAAQALTIQNSMVVGYTNFNGQTWRYAFSPAAA